MILRLWNRTGVLFLLLPILLACGSVQAFAGASTPSHYPRLEARGKTGPDVLVSVETRAWLGSGGSLEAVGTRVGYTMQLSVPTGRYARIVARAGLFPESLRYGETAVCRSGGYAGESPTDEEIAGRMACYAGRPSYYLGVGIGRSFELGRRIRTTQVLSLDGAFLPDVARNGDPVESGGVVVSDVLAAGPVVRIRFAAGSLKKKRMVDFGLEATGGLLVVADADAPLVTIPVGASAGLRVAF